MADETIAAVRFLTAVTFNGKETRYLSVKRDNCSLNRVQGGIEARCAKSRILIPYANVTFAEYGQKVEEKPVAPKAEA